MSFDFRSTQAYFRDDFVPFTDAHVGIASSPVLYGLAIYTVFGFNWNSQENKGYLFRLDEHYRRLAGAAKIMDFTPLETMLSYDEFLRIARELVTRNNIQEDALLRATLFIDEESAGTKIHGLKTSFSAYVYPLGEILPRTGARLGVSSWTRTPDNAIPSRAKINGSYVNASLMKNEALLNGFDDAIALDEHGHVAESTVANLFLVRGNRLITPDTGTDILEGITRNTIKMVAQKLQLDFEERSIDRSELYLVDEAFLCGSSARITPILEIDHRPVGDGTIGGLTQLLMEYYEQVSRGTMDDFAEWRTAVEPGSQNPPSSSPA